MDLEATQWNTARFGGGVGGGVTQPSLDSPVMHVSRCRSSRASKIIALSLPSNIYGFDWTLEFRTVPKQFSRATLTALIWRLEFINNEYTALLLRENHPYES